MASEALLPQSSQVTMEGAAFFHSSDPHYNQGVALFIRQLLAQTLITWNLFSPHLLCSCLQHHHGHLCVIVSYALMKDASAAEKDAFYDHS